MTNRSANQTSPQQQPTGDHTPGPWKAKLNKLGTKAKISGKGWIYFARVWVSVEGEPSCEGNANAALIIAAPDLLKACEDCMENRGDWAALMGDAIRKARGQS